MAAVRGAVFRSEISSGASVPSDSATTTASSPGSKTKSEAGLTKGPHKCIRVEIENHMIGVEYTEKAKDLKRA